MLGKLLKYDLINVFKTLVIFYALTLVSAIITRLLFLVENSFIVLVFAQIFNGVTISLMVNVLINSLTRVWVLFTKNVYGDESYLTHTLPVSKKDIYLSKFLTAIISMFTSVLVVLLTVFVAYYTKENFNTIKNLLVPLGEIFDSTALAIILSAFLVFFVEMLSLVVSVFTGIILGNTKNSNRVLKSIMFSFLTYLAVQIFVVISILICGLFNSELLGLFTSSQILNVSILKTLLMIATIVYSLAVAIICFVDIKLFKKGVNVN